MRRVLVFGPISLDTVIEIDKFPVNGGFVQGLERDDRVGGAGLNIAAAVASASIKTRFFSYIGDDEIGTYLKNKVGYLGLDTDDLHTISGRSLHAVITLDQSGERTVIALERNRFSEIILDVEYFPGDIVVFPVWRDFYLKYLNEARISGAKTVVGLNALSNPAVYADLLIGSEKDVAGLELDFQRFRSAIITRGEYGVSVYDGELETKLPAKNVSVIDATGAGDSFLAGVLVGLAKDADLHSCAEIGVEWASAAVQHRGSIPPKWRPEFHAK
jgi:sugar/nucleoside kinase (ribokinase family)